VNLQIHKLGPVYLSLKSTHVFHHGQVPPGCSDLTSSKLLADLSGGNFVVGEFTGPGDQVAVVVVNKDLHRSTPFGVKFKRAGQIRMVNPYTGAVQAWEGENSWLAAGQGMLLLVGG